MKEITIKACIRNSVVDQNFMNELKSNPTNATHRHIDILVYTINKHVLTCLS